MVKNFTHEKEDIEIARHDERLKSVEDFIGDIKDNHLPHIYDSLKKIELKQATWSGGIIVVVTIAQILISKFL